MINITQKTLICAITIVLLGGAFVGQSFSQDVDSPIRSHKNLLASFNFRPGEVITYKIRKFGVGIGESSLTYEGQRAFEGVQYISLLLKTKVINFNGEERIYLDLLTLLPLIVERNIVFFGKKEWIVERYNQELGRVNITKVTKKETTTQTIKKDTQVDNVQAFIFRTRTRGLDKNKNETNIHLPLSEVTFGQVKEEVLTINKIDYPSYLMEGSPRKLKVWFDQGKHLVPLRIDGKFGVGKVSLVLSDYHHESM